MRWNSHSRENVVHLLEAGNSCSVKASCPFSVDQSSQQISFLVFRLWVLHTTCTVLLSWNLIVLLKTGKQMHSGKFLRLQVAQVWYSGGGGRGGGRGGVVPRTDWISSSKGGGHFTRYDSAADFQIWISPKCLWSWWPELLWKMLPNCDHDTPTDLQLISPRTAQRCLSRWMGLLAQYCPHAAWIRTILGEGRGGLLKVHFLGSHPRRCILMSKYWSYRITALGWRTRKLGRTFCGLHLSANNLFGVLISGPCGLVVKSCLTLVIPRTVGRQTPLSEGFSRQEYCSGLPFPSSGDLPHPGIEPRFPELQADCLLTELPGKAWSEVLRNREFDTELRIKTYLALSENYLLFKKIICLAMHHWQTVFLFALSS